MKGRGLIGIGNGGVCHASRRCSGVEAQWLNANDREGEMENLHRFLKRSRKEHPRRKGNCEAKVTLVRQAGGKRRKVNQSRDIN